MDNKAAITRKILVVDDEAYVCEALKMMLSIEGHDVVTAPGAAEALEHFEQGNFDLLITDYSMPGMKGDELAAKVKSQQPELPVIMVTAYVEKLTGQEAPLRCVDELIGKPFRLEQIKAAMAKVLDATAQA